MIAPDVGRGEFADLVAGYAGDFVGRSWLVRRMDEQLADPAARIIVLTGDAGIGKTALAAHLASKRPDWLHYFIRRDSREILRPSDAKSFLLTVGMQLSHRRPNLFPLPLDIQLRQGVKRVGAGGTVIGARIQELRASPFYRSSLHLDQHVDETNGELVGFTIGKLVADVRLLSVDDLVQLALFEPARELLRLDAKAILVVLIDALDELRYSGSDFTVLDALIALPEIPANVRFVVTSRPEHLLDPLVVRRDARRIHLDAESFENENDLIAYADGFATARDLQNALTPLGLRFDDVSRRVRANAAGNFLFLKVTLDGLLRILERGGDGLAEIDALLRPAEVPGDLEALYAFFLSATVRALERGGRFRSGAWAGHLGPLLGALAVAYEPLGTEQIAGFAGLPRDEVHALLVEIRQFVQRSEITNAYRIYHASFARFILADDDRRAEWVDPRFCHRRIALHYLCGRTSWTDVRWEDVETYGLAHLATHLSAAEARTADDGPSGLRALLSPEFRRAKRRRFGSDRLFAEDARLLVAQGNESQPVDAARVIRGLLAERLTGSGLSNAPEELFRTLAWTDGPQSALAYATMVFDPDERGRMCLAVREELVDMDRPDDAASALLEAVLAFAELHPAADRGRRLRQTALALARIGRVDDAKRAAGEIGFTQYYNSDFECTESAGFDMAIAYAEVACAVARVRRMSEMRGTCARSRSTRRQRQRVRGAALTPTPQSHQP